MSEPLLLPPRREAGISRVGILILIIAIVLAVGAAGVALLGGDSGENPGDITNNRPDNSTPASRNRPDTAASISDSGAASRRNVAIAETDPFEDASLDPAMFEFTGRVVDPEKKPVAGAMVRMYVASASLKSQALIGLFREKELIVYEKARKSNAEGKFTFKGPFTDGCEYLFVITAPEFAAAEFHKTGIDGGTVTNLGDLQLSRGLEIQGKVLDHSGNPLATARVGIILSPSDAAIEKFLEQTEPEDYAPSDEQGGFHIQHLGEGRYTLIAYAPGFARAASPPIVLSQEKTARPVEITLALGDSITGTVVNVDGTGIPGATIKVRMRRAEPQDYSNNNISVEDSQFFDFPISEKTDNAGNFEIPGLLTGANYKLTAFAKDHRTAGTVAASGATGVTIQLNPDFQVRGIVADEETKQPVGGARVAVFRGKLADLKRGMGAAQVIATGSSDSTGNFVARDSGAPGNATIIAWAPGYAPALSPVFQLAENGETPETRVELNRGASISGKVTYGPERIPAIGASLNLYFTGDPTNPSTVAYRIGTYAGRAITDASGKFVFEGLLSGNYVVEARTATMGTGRTDILMIGPADQRGNVDIALPAPSFIRGTVTIPASQAGVAVRVVATRTDGLQFAAFVDATGRFLMKNLGAGQYQVRAEKVGTYDEMFGSPGRGRNNSMVPVNLREGETVDIVLDMPDSNVGMVVGTINDGGVAGSGYTLVITTENVVQTKTKGPQSTPQFGAYKTATADVDGYFEIKNVKEGTWRIYAIPRGRAITPKNAVAAESVQVFANGTARRDLFGQSGPLKGNITKPDGGPVGGARVTAVVNGNRSPSSALPAGTIFTTNSNKAGIFDFGRLPGGAYDLTIDAPGFPKKTATAEIYGGSGNPVQITMDPPPNAKPKNEKPQAKQQPQPPPTPPHNPKPNNPPRRRR